MIGLPDAAATCRWKLMSWTRNRCGSSIEANRPATSSASDAICSGVAHLGGEAGGADFENPPRLVHLLVREVVERRQQAERLAAERRRAVGNVGAGAVPRLHAAHRGERVQTHAHRRTADADLRGEIALGRQPIARPQRLALDQAADVRHDLLGAAFTDADRRADVADARSP